MTATLQSIALRPAVLADEEFLFELFTINRSDELKSLDWGPERIEEFLTQQYAAQRRFLQADYPQANQLMILRGSDRLGAIVVERSEQEIRLVDLVLLPEYRNAGVGTLLIKELLAETAGVGVIFRVQIMRTNPAVALFERLGLVKTGETGSHYQMEWRGAQ